MMSVTMTVVATKAAALMDGDDEKDNDGVGIKEMAMVMRMATG